MAGVLIAFTTAKVLSLMSGRMSTAHRHTTSETPSEGMLLPVVARRSELALMPRLKLLFAAAAMLSGTTHAETSFSGEIGLSLDRPAYSIAASASYGPATVNLLLNRINDKDTLTLANLRLSGEDVDFDIGRIGISLGLMPPAYASTVPLASDPDIYPELDRAFLRAVGIPDLGVGLTYRHGGAYIAARLYRPQVISVADNAALALRVRPAQDIQTIGLDPACTVCDIANALLGTDISAAKTDDMIFRIITGSGYNPQTFSIDQSLKQVSVGWSNSNWRLLVDALFFGAGGSDAKLLVAGVEYSNRHITAGFQPSANVGADNAVSGSGYLIFHLRHGITPYLRAAATSGSFKGEEYAGGVVLPYKAASLRIGYESVIITTDFQRAIRRGPTAAISYRF